MRAKVLFLITQSEFGGAQKYVYYLTTGLPRDQYDVTVACGTGGLLIPKLQEAGIEVTLIPSLVRDIHPIQDCLALLDLFRLIRRSGPDIVHTNSTKAGFLGRLAAKMAGGRITVFTAHGFFQYEPFWTKATRLLYMLIERLGGILTDAVIAVCQTDKQRIIGYRIVGPDKLVVVANGLQVSAFDDDSVSAIQKSSLGLSSDHKIVGTVAHFYPVKGLEFLIRAAERVKHSHPEARFVLVGDGEQRQDLERLVAELDLDSHVLFLGERDDVSQILSLFDVFVLPSVIEGMPYAILEAMACAKPVVATTVGGVPEVVIGGETGLLVRPRDPQALADAIITLLQDPERARAMGQAGRGRVLKHFTVKRMLAETAEVYQRLLAQKELA